MIQLSQIPLIDPLSLELLEAAGFMNAEALARTGANELIQEIERANKVLRISKTLPSASDANAWILAARDLTELEFEGDGNESDPTDFPQGVIDLGSAPFAIPLPARLLVDKQLTVADIPQAVFLGHTSAPTEVKKIEIAPIAHHRVSPERSGNVQVAETSVARLEIDTTRIKSTQDFANESAVKVSRPVPSDSERVALIRGPLEKTNRGRNPRSRRYIRGVLHNRPTFMKIGAVVTLTLLAVLPIAVVSAALLLLSDLFPRNFAWVSKWLLVFPASLPLLAIAYLIWGLGGSCRVCGQKQFVPRVCLKNSKAHRLPFLGYIIPVCLHMILFKWFRCTYCGTPVRLKM